jgi:uncharacterized protein YjdB
LWRLALLLPIPLGACESQPATSQPITDLQSLSIRPSGAAVPVGTSLELSAVGTQPDGTATDVSALATWTSSAPDVASVWSSWITGMTIGTATITARIGNLSTTAAVTVTEGLQSITIIPSTPAIAAGRYRQLTAMATFADGSMRDLTSQVIWSSDDPGVAAVSPYGGLARGIVAGTATVRATFGAVGAAVPFTVDPPDLVEYTIAGGSIVFLYDDAQFHAVGLYSDGSTRDLTEASSWTSDNPQALPVSDLAGTKGLAMAIAPGRANLVAWYGAQGAGAFVDVQARLLSITLSPASASVRVGAKLQFTATGTYNDGAMADLTSLMTWSSSDPNIATISAAGYPWGEATGISPGQVTISLSESGVTGSAQLTVTP